MSTSDKMVAAEAAAGALVVVAGVTLSSPSNVWMPGLGFHPGWLAIIVLAARYGPRGLFWSLAMVFGILIGVDLIGGGDLGGLQARLEGASDLFALFTATLVAWIGMSHEGRMTRMKVKLDHAVEVQQQGEATEHALHDNLGYLRGRLDRLELSLSVWRDLAGRIERGDLAEAADAALELCTIRAGASAGRVQLRDGDHLSTVIGRGGWPVIPARFRNQGVIVDKTVQTALVTKEVTVATEPGETDSEVASPIVDESGVVLGMICLRGLPPGGLRSADLHDLTIVSQWLAPALARPQKEPPRSYLVTDKHRVTARYKANVKRSPS